MNTYQKLKAGIKLSLYHMGISVTAPVSFPLIAYYGAKTIPGTHTALNVAAIAAGISMVPLAPMNLAMTPLSVAYPFVTSPETIQDTLQSVFEAADIQNSVPAKILRWVYR